MSTEEYDSTKLGIAGAIVGTILLLGFIVLGMWGCPKYEVWRMGLEGEALLNKAEQTRQILVLQAQAERDSAAKRAEAIAIVGKAAKEFPEYRQQEFLGAFAEALKEGHINQIMYVPTEANIPITEANRVQH